MTLPRNRVQAALSLLLLAALAACAPIADSASITESGSLGTPSASHIYREVAPSIAFIETPAGTGSGLLTEVNGDKYIVTNAHVVWPFTVARVAFPDATDFLDVPLVQTDDLVDLAILGPLETPIPTLPIDHHREIEPGERVYLIGYPGEGELFPVPSISEGILSRTRVWDTLDSMRFYQTDAAGAGGQSGGVLVSRDGGVIGISGMLFADEFVLATSSADLAETLSRMVDAVGEDVARPATAGHGAARRRHREQLENLWDTDGYLIDSSLDANVEAEVISDSDLGLLLFDSYPEEIASADSTYDGSEVVSATVTTDGPQIVVVEQYAPGQSSYSLIGSQRLTPIRDADDGLELAAGTMYTGTIDYPADIDWFLISLARGDEISVRVDAAVIDPLVAVGPLDADSDAYLEDDDGGRGMLGSNAALDYQAGRPGEHLIVVRAYSTEDLGGYLLSVNEVD